MQRWGQWNLETGWARPGDLNGQIRELLAMMTDDLAVWTRLSAQYRGDLNCGLFMQESNDEMILQAETIGMVGEQGLLLHFDIYDPSPD